MAARRKRPTESAPDDGDGWTRVQSKRARRRTLHEDGGEDRSSGPLPEWRLVSSDFSTHYQAIRWMEDERKLRLRVTVSRAGDFLIRAWDWDHATTLDEIAAGRTRGITLEKKEAAVKGVLLGYPTHLPLDPVLAHPCVAAAVRCHYNAGHGRRLPTRSVQLTLRGRVPASLDLGCWGRFTCRRYVPEPVRCFKCQAFGHRQRQCTRTEELCGVCSRDHATRDCVRRLREGVARPVAVCPNCSSGHHAWNRRCPARLCRIPGAKLRRTTSSADPAAARPMQPPTEERTTPHGEGRKRRRRRRRRKPGPTEQSVPTPKSPAREMEVDPPRLTRTETAAVTAEVTPPAVSPEVPASKKKKRTRDQTPETRDAPTTTEEPAPREAPSSCQATQTPRIYTFSEGELVDLLIRYEHLTEQEEEARFERIPHETALPLMRRTLREGKPLPESIRTARPLSNLPCHFDHKQEVEWATYEEDDVSEEEVDVGGVDEDLFLNADRDLTDEELASYYAGDQ